MICNYKENRKQTIKSPPYCRGTLEKAMNTGKFEGSRLTISAIENILANSAQNASVLMQKCEMGKMFSSQSRSGAAASGIKR